MENLVTQDVIDTQVIDKNDYMVGDQDFADNCEKIPVIILLDTSYSMDGQPIKDLKKGTEYFIKEINELKDTSKSIDLSVVTYNQKIVQDISFRPVDKYNLPEFIASGGTNTTKAVRYALDKAEDRKLFYKNDGQGYKQPWIVLMSDGFGGDVTQISEEVRRLRENQKLTFFSIGIGKNAPLGDMAKFGTVISVEETKNISKFFQWLSQSLDCVTQAAAGQAVAIEKPDDLYMKIVA